MAKMLWGLLTTRVLLLISASVATTSNSNNLPSNKTLLLESGQSEVEQVARNESHQNETDGSELFELSPESHAWNHTLTLRGSLRGGCTRLTDKPWHQVPCDARHCGSPPQYYVFADGNGRMNIQSFSSLNAAMRNFNWWKHYVTRVLLDVSFSNSKKEPVHERSQCSCSGCDQRWKSVTREILKVTKCKYPSHRWARSMAYLKPVGAFEKSVKVTVGRSFSSSNSVTDEVGVSVGVAMGPFQASASYRHMVESSNSKTWQSETTIEKTWKVEKGESRVVWQLELSCKGFNYLGMYVNQVGFKTDVLVDTDTLQPPSCNPLKYGDCVLGKREGQPDDKDDECFVEVSGAGGRGRSSNGRYKEDGDFNGHPKYKQCDGDSIIYFKQDWKINNRDDTGGWLYSHHHAEKEAPEGEWTTDGYWGGDANPAPTVSFK